MKLFRKLLLILIVVIIVVGIAITSKGYKLYKETVKVKTIEQAVQEIRDKKNFTEYKKLPKTYIDAVVAVEDHRFFKHKGIDVIGIGRALITNIKKKELSEGGSTITQQVGKNLYFINNKRDLDEKIAEIFVAWDLEKKYSKEEIFELYVNVSYFGDGYYTVKEASKGYFGKDPINMTDYESIMLAGIPNAPSVYAPTKNMNLALERQKHVIKRMVQYEYLTEIEAKKILNNN